LSAALALYPACAALLVRISGARGGARILALAAAWTVMEWMRGELFTGFPWNPLGNVWVASEEMIQLAALTGVFGLTLVTVLVSAAPAALAQKGTLFRRWGPSAAAAVGLVLIWGGGAWRLAGADVGVVPSVKLRIVQANIPQADKWRPALRDSHVAAYLELTGRRGGGASHVIWPETAVPFAIAADHKRRHLIAKAIPKNGLLLSGSIRVRTKGRRLISIWNSLHAVDGSSRVVETYDKFHLVPFGEYVPLREMLNFSKLTVGRQDFTPGPGPRTIELPGLPPFSPLICYEAIFPGRVTDATKRPGWLLNVTNDAWFGNSAGPYQHFASARMRAVEEGLPLVRAANTGISAVVDSYGRVTARLDLGRRGAFDASLPRALAVPPPFARYGNVTILLFALGIAFAVRKRSTGS
jgi:apolipoprotein N-acyltransferase